MKDSNIIKYIYDNIYVRGEFWSELDIYDWFELNYYDNSKLVTAIVSTLERYIFSRYKFTVTRPDYKTIESIKKFKKSYMNPLNNFRQKNRYYKPLKLKCLNYEQINLRS